ncbi:MAG: four-carbon acid sugar kinase family protein [Devosia nanyangense]|uniref:Four-carbon acid sugar kinase family protein n=1 Tax=Devosia nanyangense TaxID=1228055 RepID=A0A933NXQ7_9HYPH|nr:four-carbon acid sugar kinase family protein [Devosia nanyangense]
MGIEYAIIADDFTGALDCSTPFALSGLAVAAATRPEGLAEALASGAEVVVVNTASRALAEAEAVRRVTAVAQQLRSAGPRIVFKKIDSRLKGNVRAETDAVAACFGHEAVVVAPAIPDQGRPTIGGTVTGRGVPAPLPIAPHVRPGALIADAATDADLDRLVGAHDWSRHLAVGARGLGAAFARRHGPTSTRPFLPSPRTLFAIGSHDPITLAQVERVRGRAPVHAAPLGNLAAEVAGLPAVIQSTGPFAGPDDAISRRFAAAVVGVVEALRPDTLVMSGGDTALAILDALGVGLVFPQGEAAPGLPWFLIKGQDRPSIRCVVKSGGFGGADALAELLPK